MARLPESVQDVVLVGGNDESVGRQTHASCKVSGEDVSEISRGDDEAGGGVGGLRLAGEGEVRVDIVSDLGENAGPVDAVDGAETVGGVEVGVGEEGFEDVLDMALVRLS